MGGGGDGGYGERQAQQEQAKQRARDALNVMFGVKPSGAVNLPAPSREQFQSGGGLQQVDAGDGSAEVYQPGVFDQAGFDAAMQDYERQRADLEGREAQAASNKSALDALYGKVRTDAMTAGKRGLDEKQQTAGRDLKFELFARGLDGGSVDLDQNSLLGRIYTQGLTDLGAKADSTATGLRSNDEQTRLVLLQSIDNGMDQGSAISSALAQMKNNSDRAASEATGTTLGNLFADAGLLYDQSRRARGEQTAIDTWRRQTGGQRSPSAARGLSTWAG